jgi:hypothetical protein
MKQLRFALIGCGALGKEHLNCVAKIPQAKFVAYADVSDQGAHACLKEFGGVYATTDIPRVIADKSKPSERMRGMPISRATSQHGNWVYTLYTSDPETQALFVHALNATGRYAHCIDLPVKQTRDLFNTTLALQGRTLRIRDVDGNTLARIDTRTLTVS